MPEASAQTVDQLFLEAMRRHREGRTQEAETLYSQVLARQPQHPDALHLLGVLAHETGRSVEALELLRKAIAAAPDRAHFYRSLGVALAEQRDHLQAIQQYQNALRLRPDYAETFYNLGNSHLELRQLEKAIEAYRNALALRPDFPEAQNNLGAALEETERLEDSVTVYRELVSKHPDFPGAQNNCGNALRDLGLLDEAIAAYQTAMAQSPDPRPASRLLMTLWYHPDYDRRRIYEEHVQWERRYANALRPASPIYLNDRSPDRRLRIGYISPDFRQHVVGLNVLPLLANHDHEQFEVFGFSNVPMPDAITDRFKSYCDQWRDIKFVSDEQTARLIRADKIDVLVDLSLHAAHNRLLVMARNPAPVQVSFAGYPATTGLSAIDYRISDSLLDPPGTADDFSAERILRLPCFWCYQPLGTEPEPRAAAPKKDEPVTFGCLNNFSKVNNLVLNLWARVIGAVPGSRLVLRTPRGSARLRVLEILRRQQIGRDSLEFLDRQSRDEYMAVHRRIDICLDTYPYNGHTTMLDALWMGVPTVSLAGETSVSRAGLSILSNLGLPELVAGSQDEYVRIAVQLASDRERLAELHANLRERMKASPIMNASQFTRNIERLFRQIWREWCAAPQHHQLS